MDKQDLNKYLEKINRTKTEKTEKPKNKYLTKLLIRSLVSVVLFLVCLILCKSNNSYKDNIYRHVFYENFTFTKVNELYNKYLGGILPFKNIFKNVDQTVFNETLTYLSENKYLDGVELKVESQYLVPILESGIVVYVGEKEGYGNTVIIQQMNGIDLWYGNISNVNISLYDYVEKGSFLGEVKENTLYLAFYKEGQFLNYEEYLK